jgi:hypothetical protein
VREPLTEIAHKALSVVSVRCSRHGLDLFEELNRVGLIATEPRIREIQKLALANMIDRLEAVQPADFMREAQMYNSNPGTPDDMYKGVMGWIHNYMKQNYR